MNETDDPIGNLFHDFPERLNIVKSGIKPEVQQAYLDYAKRIDADDDAAQNALENEQKLLDPKTPPDEKKKYLIRLSREGTVEACLVLNKFIETARPDLKDWGTLALESCWLLAESRLYDKEMGMVITGMGGDDERLRFFFAVPAENNLVLTEANHQDLAQAFTRACNRFDAIVESFQGYGAYITLQTLIPIDVAPADVIENGIAEGNQNSDLLYPDYFVTNVSIPDEQEILYYIRRLRKGEARGQDWFV